MRRVGEEMGNKDVWQRMKSLKVEVQRNFFLYRIILSAVGGRPRSIIVKVLECKLEVSEFEL